MSSENIKEIVDALFENAICVASDRLKCPLCDNIFLNRGLKRHLRFCVIASNYETVPSMSLKEWASYKPKFDMEVSKLSDKEKVEYFYYKARVLQDSKLECPLCLKAFAGLRIHLNTCIKKHKNYMSVLSESSESVIRKPSKSKTSSHFRRHPSTLKSDKRLDCNIDDPFVESTIQPGVKTQCPLCKVDYQRDKLESHLQSCYFDFEENNPPEYILDEILCNEFPDERVHSATNILSKDEFAEDRESDSDYLYDDNLSLSDIQLASNTCCSNDFKELGSPKECLSKSVSKKDTVNYLYGKAIPLGSDRLQCYLCQIDYAKNGLKKHLYTCIVNQSYFDTTCNTAAYSLSAKFKPNVGGLDSKPDNITKDKIVYCNMSEIIRHCEELSSEYKLSTDNSAERLKQMALTQDDIQDNAENMKNLISYLLEWLNSKSGLKWSNVNSGSVYEKLKIYSIDEVDCMIVCNLRCDVKYLELPNKSFVQITFTSFREKEKEFCRKIIGTDGFVSPKLFKMEFTKLIDAALKDGDYKTRGYLPEGSSPLTPAVTLKTRTKKLIDIVPGIEIEGWPAVSSDWNIPSNFPDEKRSSIKSRFHLVSKCHPSELDVLPQDCKMWRLSYSAAEKLIMHHLDYGTKTNTCRKDVLRLLKSDLMAAKDQGCTDFRKSYFCKTIIMHMVQFFQGDCSWKKEDLNLKYVQGLLVLKKCVELQYIEHGFIKGENLLNHVLSDLSRETEIKKMVSFINKRLKII